MKPFKWTPLLLFYLLCSIAGLLVPWYFNLQHMLHSPVPFSIIQLFEEGTHSNLASSLTYDFLIASSAATVFMIIEIRRLKMKFLWFYVVFTFLIAFAFTFPLFLFNRERKILKMRYEKQAKG